MKLRQKKRTRNRQKSPLSKKTITLYHKYEEISN